MIQSLYHLSDEEINNLTMKEFYIKEKNIINVAQLYNPYMGEGDEEQSKSIKGQSGNAEQLALKIRARGKA